MHPSANASFSTSSRLTPFRQTDSLPTARTFGSNLLSVRVKPVIVITSTVFAEI
jgi:hypothetical protein